MRQNLVFQAGCVVLGTAMLFAIPSCDNASSDARDQSEAAITEAARELQMIAINTGFPISSETRLKIRGQYESIIGSLKRMEGELSVQLANKQALAADAHLGLARLDLEEAGESLQRLTGAIWTAHRELDEAIDIHAMQLAAESFQVADSMQLIEASRRAAATRKVDLLRLKSDIEKTIDDLRDKIQTERVSYDKLSDEKGRLRETVSDTPLDEKRALNERIAEISRSADEHQVAAANYEAVLDTVQPELSATTNRIIEIEAELISYDVSEDVLKQRAAQAVAEASKRKKQLEEAIHDVSIAFDAAASLLANETKGKWDSALQQAGQARTKADSARRGSLAADSRLVLAMQMSGDIHMRRLSAMKSWGSLVGRMADHSTLLQRGGQDETLLKQVEQDIEDDTAAAVETFTSALTQAESLDSDGIAESDHTRLVVTLQRIIDVLEGREVDDIYAMDTSLPDRDTTFATETVVATRPAESPAELLTQIMQLYDAQQYAGIVKLYYVDDSASQQILDMGVEQLESLGRLNVAVQNATGESFYDYLNDPDAVSRTPTLAPVMAEINAQGVELAGDDFLTSLYAADIDSLEFGYDGRQTTAWVTNDLDLSDLVLVHMDGQWRLQIELPANMTNPQMLEIQKQIAPLMAEKLDGLVDRVEAGEFSNPYEVAVAFEGILLKVAEEMMGDLMGEMGDMMEDMMGGKGGG